MKEFFNAEVKGRRLVIPCDEGKPWLSKREEAAARQTFVLDGERPIGLMVGVVYGGVKFVTEDKVVLHRVLPPRRMAGFCVRNRFIQLQ